ncbi:MAG TPA: ABC transporter permease, partial [Candidatus Methylomirabilis sp.]|nr:ABC transporter permease [Candidatus Methylomirabilis sp.]
MLRYILRRLIYMTPILFGVSLVIFLILHLVPGDPARLVAGLDATQEDVKIIRSRLGLDRPLPVQYLSWLGNVLHGDLGRST